MATNTTNYGWTKPSYEDVADIEVINDTIDNIDAQVKTNENNISAVTMGTQSTGDIDLNAVTTNSYKMYTNTTSNLPTSDGSWYFVKTTVFDDNTMLQEATAMNAGAKTYTRIKRSGNWQAWKLSNLDSTQEAAVNSGINDTLVGQITTNQNNILTANAELIELVDSGAKNKLLNKGTMSKDNITYTWTNGNVVVSGTKTSGGNHVEVFPLTKLSDLGLNTEFIISNNGTNCYLSIIFWSASQGYSSSIDVFSGSNVITIPTGYTHLLARLGVKSATTGTVNETIQPMICSKSAWDVSQKYVPYAMTNAEITAWIQAHT